MKYLAIALLVFASAVASYIIFSAWANDEGIRAICRDGTISKSKVNRGTCSRHGGVLYWTKE